MTKERRELGGQKDSGGMSEATQTRYENTKVNKRKVGINKD